MATKSKKKKAKAVVKAKAKTKSPIKKIKSAKSAPMKAVKKSAKPVPAPKAASKPAAKTASKPAGRAMAAAGLISPLQDLVIVRVEMPEEKTAGGLYIPTSAGERPNRGEVIATGPGRRNKKGQLRPLDVSVGDNVLFPQYSGTQIKVDEQEFLILREEEVLGIVT